MPGLLLHLHLIEMWVRDIPLLRPFSGRTDSKIRIIKGGIFYRRRVPNIMGWYVHSSLFSVMINGICGGQIGLGFQRLVMEFVCSLRGYPFPVIHS